jgi:iron only hydrogenase large subunit-like protein
VTSVCVLTNGWSIACPRTERQELDDVLARNAAMSVDSGHAAVSEGDEGPVRVVVSLSPQSVASLAVRHKLSAPVAFKKIAGHLKSIGVDAVYDTTFGRSFSLVETHREFMMR